MIVDSISSFFNSKPIPKFLDEQPESTLSENLIEKLDKIGSTTKSIFQAYVHIPTDISFDIQKTDSFTTSLLGYVKVTCKVLYNRGTGGELYDDLLEMRYHTTIRGCLSENTFKYWTNIIFNLKYSYEKDKWVFKNVSVSFDSNGGKQLPPYIYDDDWNRHENSHWQKAFRLETLTSN